MTTGRVAKQLPKCQGATSEATSIRTRTLLAILTLLAFALFTWRMEANSIWWDESLSLY